tara:strand:+ start:165 stop:1121 length:957 start_codon:yes stop_codon:yes gene_type:complete
MTRLFTLEIGESKEQIGAALETQAAIEMEGTKPLEGVLASFQAYLQLKAPFEVVVPYAGELANAMKKMVSAPRILRDFARLLSLIKSVAIIRHHQRKTNTEGRLMATLADYDTVRELVNDMYIDSTTGATSEIQKLIAAVKAIDVGRTEGERITVQKLATYLDINKMAVSRWAKRAQRENWLVNKESRKGYHADFTIGEAMPETKGLPTLEDMRRNTITLLTEGVLQQNSCKNGDCNTVTPLTVNETPPYTPTNDYASVLGMPIENVIELWHSVGAPIIHLSQGVSCADLGKLLSQTDVSPENLEALRAWLQERKGGK